MTSTGSTAPRAPQQQVKPSSKTTDRQTEHIFLCSLPFPMTVVVMGFKIHTLIIIIFIIKVNYNIYNNIYIQYIYVCIFIYIYTINKYYI